MIGSNAGRAPSPPPPPPSAGPSFLRRHPVLAGFGVLAALSLFAAYWPASAIVTGAVVAARASGADRVALGLLRRAGRRVVDRVREWGRGAPGRGVPEPGAPVSEPPAAAEPPVATPEPPVAAPEPSPVAVAPPPAPAGPPPAPHPRHPRPAPRARRRPAQPAGFEVER